MFAVVFRLRSHLVVLLLLGGAVFAGCNASSRDSRTGDSAAASDASKDPSGDALAGDDADRAAAELDAQEQERARRGRRPVRTDPRGGMRSVDQPRVTPRR